MLRKPLCYEMVGSNEKRTQLHRGTPSIESSFGSSGSRGCACSATIAAQEGWVTIKEIQDKGVVCEVQNVFDAAFMKVSTL
jgi:hypothetical protein